MIQRNIPLAPYTTYKIGGPADYLMEAISQSELVDAVNLAREHGWPLLILGTGANILMSDKGFRGLVIINRAQEAELEGNMLTAGSGAVVADLIQLTKERGLSGLEHYAGIPSTVGGALWQNLHFLSPDRSRTTYISEVVQSARVLFEDGSIKTLLLPELNLGYDESIFRERPELIALSATFALTPEDPAVLAERIEANLQWRAERQPDVVEYPSCGSVFKKIEGVGAGRLIEQVGLKGHQIGGAQISEKHANFIVNRGGATAADVLALIALVQEKVKEETGYELEPEIRVTGEL